MNSEIRPPFRTDIEGLRGIAVLLVVAYHAGLPGITGGYVGVDVFFVLSGYLITWLLLREIEETRRLDLVEFYARRARRLLPALAVVLVATTAAAFVLYSPLEQLDVAKTAFVTAAYVSNVWFAGAATDYFGTGVETNPLLHTWSLAVEEQFYFVWPMIMFFAFASARRAQGQKPLRSGRAVLVISVIAVTSFVLCVWLTHTKQPWAFFLSPTRAWEFCAGALGLLIVTRTSDRWKAPLGWLGLAAILCSAALFDRATPFPGIAALLPVLGTVVVLRAGASGSPDRLSGVLGNWAIQQFGRLSYSWYLWHWPVLMLTTAAVGPLSLPGRLGCLTISLGLAEFSYRLIEYPVRHSPLLMRRPKVAIGMAVAVTVFSAGTALLWRSVAKDEAQSVIQAKLTAAKTDMPSIWNKCIPGFFPTALKECTFGSVDSSLTVVLFGDSHAAHWFPALHDAATSKGWRLVTLLKAACPPADVDFVYPALHRRYVECEAWRTLAVERIKQIHPNAIVITSSQWYAVTPEAWLAGMRRTLQALNESGARVVQLAGTPGADFNVPDCLARAAWRKRWYRASSCTFSRSAHLDAKLVKLEQSAANDFKNVRYVDLTAHICPDTDCPPERDDLVVYADGHHLTASFARTLAPLFREMLQTTP